MKKLLLLMAFIMPFLLTSCGDDKDDNKDFNYPLETLYGTWQITHFSAELTSTFYTWEEEKTTVTFQKNGKDYGEGYLGTGEGTYTAIGDRITTYVNGEIYLIYDVVSLDHTTAVLKLYTKEQTAYMYIKCIKI